MRWLITLLVLAVAAAGLALAGRYDPGYAVLVFPPWRIELSFVTLVILLALMGLLAYWLTRLAVTALQLPEAVRAHREKIRREQAHLELQNAAQAFLEGRNREAEKLAGGYSGNEKQTAFARVIAARAADQSHAEAKRESYLSQSLENHETLAARLFEAEIRLKENNPQAALTAISAGLAISPNHAALLDHKLEALQMAGEWEGTLKLAEQLDKEGAADKSEILEARRRAQIELIKGKTGNPAALLAFWKKLPGEDKAHLPVILAAAHALEKSGEPNSACDLLERALETVWHDELLAEYAHCGSEPLKQIEKAEAWLKSRPRDAKLLLALAQLCAREGLWGKAQSYLEASLSLSPSADAHIAMAEISEKTGRVTEASEHYRKALALCRSAK